MKFCFLFLFFFFLIGSIVAQIDYGVRDISFDVNSIENDVDIDFSNEALFEKRKASQCLTTPNISSTCLIARQRVFPSDKVQLSCVYLNSLFYGLIYPLNELHISASECDSSPRSTGNCKKLAPLKDKKDYYFNKAEQSICIQADIDNVCKFKSDSCSRWYDIEVPNCNKGSAIVSIFIAKSPKSFEGYPNMKSCRFGFPLTTGVTTHAISTGAITTGVTTGVTTGITTGVTTGITSGVTTGITTGIPQYEAIVASRLAANGVGTETGYAVIVGSSFVPTQNIIVTQLGYFCDPRNSATQADFLVGLYLDSNQQLITSATVTLKPCTSLEYQYVTVTPVTLTSGTSYLIGSISGSAYYWAYVDGSSNINNVVSSDLTFAAGKYDYAGGMQYPYTSNGRLYALASYKYMYP